jgi:TolB-like protein/tetratricopeptide (TPR) repeat protein
MSPEQLGGRDADRRSDLFSLGIVYFEMLTGRRPFTGASMAELTSSILRDPPPPLAEIRADVPPRLAELLIACLEKDPSVRTASATELIEGLTEARQVFLQDQMGPPTTHDQRSGVFEHSVAVIDFENIVGDPEVDWLSGGIAETITVDLKKVHSLRIIGRDKVVKVLERLTRDPGMVESAALGRELGATVVVAGGFQKSGDSIRVTARLVDVRSGEVQNTFRVDGSSNAVFELQDQVVSELTRQLNVTEPEMVKAPVKPRSGQLEAFECFAKGRYQVRLMTMDSFAKARELFSRALEIEPDYALAQAGLGELYSLKFIGTTDTEDLQTAIAHLSRAIELDPDLPDPYPWLCYSLFRDGRVDEAVVAGRRAIGLDADSPLGHYFLAVALWIQTGKASAEDQWSEVFEEFDTSRELSPRYQAAHQLKGAALLFRGRYDEAGEALECAAEIETADAYELARFVGGNAMLARLRFRQGDLDEAMRIARRSLEILSNRNHVYQTAMLCLTHGVIGDVLFRRQNPADAIGEYRKAVESALSHPQGLGVGSVLVRSRLGLARCLQAMDMDREAATLYEDATDLFRHRQGFDFSWTADLTDGDLYMETAIYHAAAGHTDEALGALELAVRCKWGDIHFLRSEPLFEPLRTQDRFIELAARIAETSD